VAQISNLLSLLPSYLVLSIVILVVLPSIMAIALRYFLYRHLTKLTRNTRKLLAGIQLELLPKTIARLEQRFQEYNSRREPINTAAVVEGEYSEEQFGCLGFSLNCESIESFSRILPNLLLSLGLLGTFLGITLNLSNLSQTVSQADISDVRNLIAQLGTPLQGMGIAFISSLIAIAFSSLLTIVNLIWNTNLAKINYLNNVEDYIDNVVLPRLQPLDPTKVAIEKFNRDFSTMLHKLAKTIENSMNQAFVKVEKSADIFDKAANTLEQSRFPEKLATATNNLAIAQDRFSQSSLVLHQSTQSFEYSLDGMQKISKKLVEMNELIDNIDRKYTTIVNLNQQKNSIEESGLKDIQVELAKLVNKMQQLSRNSFNSDEKNQVTTQIGNGR
jgi:hypothetical protein